MLVRAMLVYSYVLKRWCEAMGFAFHGAGVSAVQLLMRPTQYAGKWSQATMVGLLGRELLSQVTGWLGIMHVASNMNSCVLSTTSCTSITAKQQHTLLLRLQRYWPPCNNAKAVDSCRCKQLIRPVRISLILADPLLSRLATACQKELYLQGSMAFPAQLLSVGCTLVPFGIVLLCPTILAATIGNLFYFQQRIIIIEQTSWCQLCGRYNQPSRKRCYISHQHRSAGV